MSEDRLGDALRAEVADTHASADAFARLKRRVSEPERSAERRGLLVGVVVVLVVALVAGAVALLRDPSPQRAPAGRARSGAPRRILAITETGQPIVVDTRTGRRVSGYDSSGYARGTQIAVVPDGSSLYFEQGNGNEGCQGTDILRLPLRHGPPGTVVAQNASEPVVSPDGRYLAFYRCLPGDARPRQLAVRDLRLGGDRVFTPPASTWFGERLLFDTDSHHLIFELGSNTADLSSRFRRLDLVGNEAMPGQAFGVAGPTLLGSLDRDRYLVVAPHVEGGPHRSVGDLVGSVGSTPAIAGERSEAFNGWFWLPSDVTSAGADRTGRHVVAVSRSTLYRWSRGDDRPTKLRDGIVAAAWIPDPRPAPTEAPALAVVQAHTHLRVYLGLGSEVVRDVADVPLDARIAAMPDGASVLAGGFSGGCAPPSSIDRVDLTGGSRTPIAAGEYPVASSTGLVAYEIRCDGVSLGTTDLVSGVNTRSDPMLGAASEGSSHVRSVTPVAFSPDGSRLLYRAHVRGHGGHWYVGRVRRPGLVDQVRRLPVAEGTQLTFVDDEHLAGAYLRFPHSTVRIISVPRGGGPISVGRAVVRFRGAVTSMSADPSGRWFLAVLRGGALVSWGPGVRPFQVVPDASAAAWLPNPVG